MFCCSLGHGYVLDTPAQAKPQKLHHDFTNEFLREYFELALRTGRALPLPVGVLAPLSAEGRALLVVPRSFAECGGSDGGSDGGFDHLLTGERCAGAPRTLHVPHGSAAVFTGGLVHAGAKGSGARNLAAHWQSTAIAMAIPNEIAVCPGPQPDGAGTTAAEEVFV